MVRAFLNRRRLRSAGSAVMTRQAEAHAMTSDFVAARCRFTVECACGAHLETRYIDEALEWRELHEVLGPLEDALAP